MFLPKTWPSIPANITLPSYNPDDLIGPKEYIINVNKKKRYIHVFQNAYDFLWTDFLIQRLRTQVPNNGNVLNDIEKTIDTMEKNLKEYRLHFFTEEKRVSKIKNNMFYATPKCKFNS